MHINGSKAQLASHKDRHDNVGRGEIPLSSFGYLMRDTRLKDIPMILETPINDDPSVWQKEIEVLYKLQDLFEDDTEGLQGLEDEIAKSVAKSVKDVKPKATTKAKAATKAKPVAKKKGAKRSRDEEEESEIEDGQEEKDGVLVSPLSSMSSLSPPS